MFAGGIVFITTLEITQDLSHPLFVMLSPTSLGVVGIVGITFCWILRGRWCLHLGLDCSSRGTSRLILQQLIQLISVHLSRFDIVFFKATNFALHFLIFLPQLLDPRLEERKLF